MGFGKLVAEATGQETALSEGAPPSLPSLILDRYGRNEDKPPPGLDRFYYRASGLAYICPREEVLKARHGLITRVRQPAEEIANYDVGSGMHYAMQNIILPAIGVIRGAWRCLGCGHVHGAREEGKTVYEVAIQRPDACSKCGYKEFLYDEYFIEDKAVGTGGHMDGLLVLPRHEGMGGFELKSISQASAKSKNIKNCPQIEHVLQANAYMRMAGLKWLKLMYWIKGVYSIEKNLIQHHLEPDDAVWDSVRTTLYSIRKGMETGELPDRVCAHRACARAQECPALTQCFGDAAPDGAVGLI